MKITHHNLKETLVWADVQEAAGHGGACAAGTSNQAAASILQFCGTLQGHICNSAECDHVGRSCEAAGCDNRVCKVHERYCSNCELRYCEDCYEPHLDACCGTLADGHDAAVEEALCAAGQTTKESQSTRAEEVRCRP